MGGSGVLWVLIVGASGLDVGGMGATHGGAACGGATQHGVINAGVPLRTGQVRNASASASASHLERAASSGSMESRAESVESWTNDTNRTGVAKFHHYSTYISGVLAVGGRFVCWMSSRA